jgi:hypothetical protein
MLLRTRISRDRFGLRFDTGVLGATRRAPPVAAVRNAVGSHRRALLVLAPVIAIALWASCWVAFATAGHMGVQYDSASYLGAAAELRSGHGPAVPSTYWADDFRPHVAASFDDHVPSSHFPPGYPIVLALTSFLTGQILGAARLLGIVLVFVNVMLVGVLTARMTGYRSVVLPALPAALLVFTSDLATPYDHPSWLTLHAYVYSEPLFIAAATGCLLVTATAVASPRFTWRYVGMAAALAAVALLTRYAGVAVVLTLGLSLLLFDAPRRFVRARGTVAVCAAAVAPLCAFLVWATLLGGRSARAFAYHPQGETHLLFSRFELFFFPGSWPTAFRTSAFVVLGVLVVLGLSRRPRSVHARVNDSATEHVLRRVILLFLACYVVVILCTQTFFDAATPLSARVLSPIRGPVYAIAIVALYELLVEHWRPVAAATAVALACGALVCAGWSIERLALRPGTGDTHAATATEIMVARLPKRALIVTDDAAGLYFAVGRGSLSLPGHTMLTTGRPNRHFEPDLREWAALLRQRPSYVFKGTPVCTDCRTATAELLRLLPTRLISASGTQRLYEVTAGRS